MTKISRNLTQMATGTIGIADTITTGRGRLGGSECRQRSVEVRDR